MILGSTKTPFAPKPPNKIPGVCNMGICHDFNSFFCQSTFTVACENEWTKIIKLPMKYAMFACLVVAEPTQCLFQQVRLVPIVPA